jgi:hypothetical protein
MTTITETKNDTVKASSNTMKIAKKTLDILKRFALVNPEVYVRPGNVLQTISKEQTVDAVAITDQEFSQEFCTADLPRFVDALNQLQDPEVSVVNGYPTIMPNGREIFRSSTNGDDVTFDETSWRAGFGRCTS